MLPLSLQECSPPCCSCCHIWLLCFFLHITVDFGFIPKLKEWVPWWGHFGLLSYLHSACCSTSLESISLTWSGHATSMGIIEFLVWKIMRLKINQRTSPLWAGTKLSAVIQILPIIHVFIHNLEWNRNKDLYFVFIRTSSNATMQWWNLNKSKLQVAIFSKSNCGVARWFTSYQVGDR